MEEKGSSRLDDKELANHVENSCEQIWERFVENELRFDQCDEPINLKSSILHSLLHEEVLERRMPKR